MSTDLERALPQEIHFNYEAIRQELSEQLEKYQGIAVTQETIREAKGDKARLNALRKSMSDWRIGVKKKWNAPLAAFEEKVKELDALIDGPVSAIDQQLKAFDEARKQARLERLKEVYSQYIGELIHVLPLEKVLPPKWGNAGTAEGAVIQEMAAAIVHVRSDLKRIEGMRLPCEIQVKRVYMEHLSLSEALEEKERYERRAAELEAIKAANQAAEPEAVRAAHQAPEPPPPERPAGERKTIRAVFYDTTPAFRAEMNALIKRHQIKVEAI